MEGAGNRGRWNKKPSVGTILLLMCMLVPTLPLPQPSGQQTCPLGDYLSEKGICCDKCHRGFKLEEECHAVGQRSKCTPCPIGQFTDQSNFSPNCMKCRQCKDKNNEIESSRCEIHKDTICQCKDGYYKKHIDSETYECLRCTQCRPDEKQLQKCTPEKNTVCECKENYYKVNNKCEPCKNCTIECKDRCSPTQNTKAPEPGNEHLINIIAGATAVALVLLVLVILFIYMVTKCFIKKELQQPRQPSDVSPDFSQHALICDEDSLDNSSVKAIPQSIVIEQNPSNLPDCVPLEIKIPDLIYTVLDLVPVLQLKQLVRTLGVRDTDIVQAELDNRACREAHYQMLRVWIERGSPAGGGARGEVLQRPMLQELLDKLRQMHLGSAAEELETKYAFQ
ncbi:tumor necrosis factor receptor superfamily member 1A [Toxotes jaculatrix]|uniref:tumor necrosis factor receptor superfamily member 1A n=1 Tax=Toxotes jaculatrix TaxID=941984 RepID=UPI001B3AEBB0|nr:tumor necrosis factor receptor superfamily member 1A [Toxotes jaculatrix]XP_040900198.1 tumor necrosis factor receptor superfamily member 1A [Toxotes jaculatrix]